MIYAVDGGPGTWRSTTWPWDRRPPKWTVSGRALGR